MLHKNFDHVLERLLLFQTGKQYSKDQQISITTQFYPETIQVKQLKVLKNTGRVKPETIPPRLQEFEDAKIGDTFGQSWDTHWFFIEIELPNEWLSEDKEVHFQWNGKCEAAIYNIDGSKLLQAITENVREKYAIKRLGIKNDLKDENVNKTGSENRVQYLLEMACNEMFGNFEEGFNSKIDMKRKFVLEKCEVSLFNRDAWNLFFNFELLRDGAKEFEKTQSQRAFDCLLFANQIMNECYPPYKEKGMIDQALDKSNKFIESRKNNDSQHTVYAVGHCHIDTAWLWPYAETKRKIARSWSTQMELMKHYKDFKFCASQVGQYWWLKKNYPEVFERVKQYVKEGQFEIVGGSWVELDGNVPSGESMIRQFLYGQRFLKQEFGQQATVFFMPDTFGYSPQLPQIMKSAGIEYFLTQKLSWSVFNKFPHSTFYWRGIDGTEVLTHFPPADTYNSNGSLEQVLMSQTNFKDKGRSNSSLLLFGDGDGGGGPQIEHIERLVRLQDFDGAPKVKFGTVKEFFEQLEPNSKNLMKWEGELYLELHNGTYTSMSDNKKYNREMEIILRDVEIFSSYAAMLDPQNFKYDVEAIREMWHVFLIDQFHDVLPGTCIGMVYDDTKQNFQELQSKAKELKEQAILSILNTLLGQKKDVKIQSLKLGRSSDLNISDGKQAALIFNTLPLDRLVRVSTNIGEENLSSVSIVKGMSMQIVDQDQLKTKSLVSLSLKIEEEQNFFNIENRYYQIKLGKDGKIHSWKDKRTKNFHRQICRPGEKLNKLTIHQDVPFFWDAWDVMHHDFETGIELTATEGSAKIEQQTSTLIKISFKYEIECAGVKSSTILQTVAFYNETARVDFITKVQWREAKKLLKAYFPIDIRSDYATFDIQNGTIRRQTHGNTSWDQAKYEVYAHKFCDISEAKFGMAILNDCKYGYSVRDNNIGLTLLKAPKFPNHMADMCESDDDYKEFIYSALPHERPLAESNVFAEAYNLNTLIHAVTFEIPEDLEEYIDQQSQLQQLTFIDIDMPNVAIGALKKAEDGDHFILRIHEERGEQVTAVIKIGSILDIKSVAQVDSLERNHGRCLENQKVEYTYDSDSGELTVKLDAYKIASFALYREQGLSGASQDDTNVSQKSGISAQGANQNAGNGSSQAPVNFSNIVDFLKDHQRQMYTRETEWLFEKSQMQQRINQLEAQLRGQENINADLIKRIKMLEFSLRQERVKYAKLAQGNSNIGNTDIIGSVLQKANLNTNLYEKIAKRRAKAQRPLLLKFLQEIGYEDIFNTEEIQEIKALYEKAQEELKENLNNPNYQQQLEEKLLQDENLQRQLQYNQFINYFYRGIEERNQQKQEEGKALSQLIGEPDLQNVVKKEIQPKFIMRSHLDIVRGLQFIQDIDTLASISEDCTLKLWSMKNLEQSYQETEGNPEPYITIRGHTGPLFSITGPHNTYSKVIFTAGKEGVIRVFNLPTINEVNSYGDTYDGKNYCIGQWSENIDEAYWDIKHHPYSNMLLSISSSGSIKVWDTNHIQLDNQDNKEKIINSFNFQDSSNKNLKDFQDVPTCSAWLENQHTSFAVGYRSSIVAMFDNQQSTVLNSIQLQQPTLQNPYAYQINQLACHQSMSILATAHENGSLNFIDYNSNKVVKTVNEAHRDSISCIKFGSQNNGLNVITGSHDGSIKIWDLRNHQCVGEVTKAHGRKYDEGVLCIDSYNGLPIFASGGADSFINIYELNLN